MTRTLLITGAALLALGGTAVAQTPPATDSMTATPDAGMAAPDSGMAKPDPAMASPSTDSSATGTATPADTGTTQPTTQGAMPPADATAATPGMAPAGTPMAAAGTASEAVQKDWAKYDPKNTGTLTPLAFGTWLMASRGQDMTKQVMKTQTGKQANLPAVKVLNATASDFAKADTDHDRKITPGELTAYLSM